MNSIVQYCAFFVLRLCFVKWVQGKRELTANLDNSTVYLPAQCEGNSVRLTGGPNEFEGRVELCVNGNWGQVCAMGWTRDDAQVVCHQLGYTNGCELLHI